ncbi:MAG: amidoligase family protein [Pseudomonadales bacterium]|nr:amidoligase family protein [Pseudomonadales bacterium]
MVECPLTRTEYPTMSFADYRASLWPLPMQLQSHNGNTRRIGVELEFAGLEINDIARLCQQHLGGELDVVSDYEIFVRGTRFGDFGIELDYSYLKKLGREKNGHDQSDDIENLAESVLALIARQLVPYEIVTPPIPVTEAFALEDLIKSLRQAGARGTGHAAEYAFGLHLNPELPDLEPTTLFNYLRAFLCLFDWLKHRSNIDLSRKITPYIDGFDHDYARFLLKPGYAPTMTALIDDYLTFNPTRNRALDMLPIFAHVDEDRVQNTVQDDRVKPRPAFHYRMPNCLIDESDWALVQSWRDWLQIEALASDTERLDQIASEYYQHLNSLGRLFTSWREKSARWLTPELL